METLPVTFPEDVPGYINKQEEYEMKKRLLTLALCCVMALSLAACGGGNSGGGTSAPADSGGTGSRAG